MLLGSAGISTSADFQNGVTAFQSGDYATALRKFKPLAEQGHAPAQYNLGVLYAFGDGVQKDYVRAHMWGNIAISIGGKNKGKVRDLVEKKMTPAEIAESLKLFSECVRKKYKGC